MGHPLGPNLTLFSFFFLDLSYISYKKLVSFRIKAADYFPKIFVSR